MLALRKTALRPAQRLQEFVPAMRHKGRIQVGADADITVFDPETVIDNATFEKPMQYSSGFHHVLVGGTFVVRDAELVDGVFPGRAVRNRLVAQERHPAHDSRLARTGPGRAGASYRGAGATAATTLAARSRPGRP